MHWIVLLWLCTADGHMKELGAKCFVSQITAEDYQEQWTQQGYDRGEERFTCLRSLDAHPADQAKCGECLGEAE